MKKYLLSITLLLVSSSVGYFAWSYQQVSEVDLKNVAICFGCHGEQGNIVYEETPVIAGKEREYLLVQLKMIKKGQREVPEMEKLLQDYSHRQLLEAAHYYASLPKPQHTEEKLNCAGCHVTTSNEPRYDLAEPH